MMKWEDGLRQRLPMLQHKAQRAFDKAKFCANDWDGRNANEQFHYLLAMRDVARVLEASDWEQKLAKMIQDLLALNKDVWD